MKSTRYLEKLVTKRKLDHLEVLDLSGCVFREEKLGELSKKLLAHCENLTFIDFSWTKLNRAATIQDLLQHESYRQEQLQTKRKKLLILRFSSGLHIRSGDKLLRNMNIRVEFIEKKDNSTKLKLHLFPYREEFEKDDLPK